MRLRIERSLWTRGMVWLITLGLAWSIVVRYSESGHHFQTDFDRQFTTHADCLWMLTRFRGELLRSFSQYSFAGEFDLTGTIISIQMNPDPTPSRRWLPWNSHVVWVKSACRES
jgi:hypothetical protein